MPTRRLVVALSVLLFGVLAIGIGTALNRAGDDGGKSPTASPTTSAPFVSETPFETPTPEPTVAETPTPTPTPAPSVSGGSGGNGSGSGGNGGNGGGPKMPNTGLPAVAPLALVTLGAATALQQRRRHLDHPGA